MTKCSVGRLIAVCLTVAVCILPSSTHACNEVFIIDSVEYAVSEQWCNRALDSSQIAQPKDLVRLPQEYTFEDYRIYVLPETREAFVAMAQAARRDSIMLIVDSGFRSPGYQERIYRRRLQRGETIEKILRSVAPPGYSEHHTGRAVDLCPSEARFAHTDTYRWLRENASRFGFTESLPEDKANDGSWESWHWYFQGKP